MSKIDDGGMVYPRAFYTNDNCINSDEYQGLTRRDWLAGLAMQGFIAAGDNTTDALLAKWAYESADAMIDESRKGKS